MQKRKEHECEKIIFCTFVPLKNQNISIMLRIGLRAAAIGLLSLFICSCEQGELLNSEADIINVTLPNMPDSLKVGEARITNTRVRVPHLANTPGTEAALQELLKTLEPVFELTPGATIENVTEVNRGDFNYPQHFLVTSEDKQWSKLYEFTFFRNLFYKTAFSFEHFETFSSTRPYYVFFEMDEDLGKQEVWSSGNAGFSITAGSAGGDEYPTAVTKNGYEGNGAKLVTRSTGTLGAMMGKPIAAGNLFLGNFDMSAAMQPGDGALKATRFGVPTVMDEPVELTFWAKYVAGPEYKDVDGNVLDVVDRPEIYAVLYEPQLDAQGTPILLDGTNVKTADNIICIADMTAEQAETLRVSDIENDDYVQVSVPFVTREGKAFDVNKQINGQYCLALVFSSSAKGAAFEGAVGSTLYVDEVEIVTK